MQIFLKDLEIVKLFLACIGGGSARLKFWRRSRDLKMGVGTRRLNLAAYAARDGFAAKSHSTTTQYRYFEKKNVTF